MSNHYHLVLYVNELEINNCSNEEICERWNKLYSLPPLVQRYLNHELNGLADNDVAIAIIDEWRERLLSISWFMRGLNEFVARKANKEDGCKGHFWEGRFKSQALLDEKAVLTCMAYVDLNPIRASMATSVDSSAFTSIHERIHGPTTTLPSPKKTRSKNLPFTPSQDPPKECFINKPKPLLPFIGAEHEGQLTEICYSFIDYLELVDWTGRIIREDKRGAISSNTPALLAVLGLESATWLELALSFGRDYYGAVGSLEELSIFAKHTGRHWVSKQRQLQSIF
jgi:hypothetical protein